MIKRQQQQHFSTTLIASSKFKSTSSCKIWNTIPTTAAVTFASATLLATIFLANNGTSTITRNDENSSSKKKKKKIEIDLMDRLASKPYVHYHEYKYTPSSSSFSSSNGGRRAPGWWRKSKSLEEEEEEEDEYEEETSDDDEDDENDDDQKRQKRRRRRRPNGIPKRIRILSIDVPEMKDLGFDLHGENDDDEGNGGGECFVNYNRIFKDGIASPKQIKRQNTPSSESKPSQNSKQDNSQETKNNEEDENTIKISQKSLAQSLIQCRTTTTIASKGSNNNDSNSNATTQRHVLGPIGVDLLETSVYNLNPYNMRRTYQFGSYQYDPGKYDTMKRNDSSTSKRSKKDGIMTKGLNVKKNGTNNTNVGRRRDESDQKYQYEGSGPADSWEDEIDYYDEEENENENIAVYGDVETKEPENLREESTTAATSNSSPKEKKNKKDGTFIIDDGETTRFTTEEDEIDAPWNQYAWIEEMQLRIKGQVQFGAAVEQISFLSRFVFGNSYRSTVPSSRGYLSWLWPSFLSWNNVGDDGIDGDYDTGNSRHFFRRRKSSDSSNRNTNQQRLNRASNKPHAVIANGLAMQRVPGSLRFLTKCCREADVPLFIINDPRVWGGNTHTDLESAVEDMRKTIKTRIVVNALNIKEKSAFERGRLLGKIETETKWQAKDAARMTRQRLREVRERMKRKNEDDWSECDKEDLLDKLSQRKVIAVEKRTDGSSRDVTEVVNVGESMQSVCHECLKTNEVVSKTDDKDDGDNMAQPSSKATIAPEDVNTTTEPAGI